MKIGTLTDEVITPKTGLGMAVFSGLVMATAAATASPIAVIGMAGAALVGKLWRDRDDNDGYLGASPLDALADDNHMAANTDIINTLASYGLPDARLYDSLHGHVLTRHLVSIPRGTTLGKLPGDDIARDLGVPAVTIGTNAGRGLISVDVPREDRQTVIFSALLDSPQWAARSGKLPVMPAVDVIGNPVIFDLESAPHLLVGGTTGQGKSVFMNALILSLMQSGADWRLMIGDGKNEDLAPYYGNSKYLLAADDVTAIETEVAGIAHQVKWLAAEMDNRFKTGLKPFPIVLVIDELADLVMLDDKDQTIVKSLSRIAQKGRSARIHLVIGTQYPSSTVLPDLLRMNIPSRAGLTTAKDYESKVVLGETGCEKLLGKGDCLLKLIGRGVDRIHGAKITEDDLKRFIV